MGQVNLQNMTAHRWFENKSCPGDYIYNRAELAAQGLHAHLTHHTMDGDGVDFVVPGAVAVGAYLPHTA